MKKPARFSFPARNLELNPIPYTQLAGRSYSHPPKPGAKDRSAHSPPYFPHMLELPSDPSLPSRRT